MADKFYKFLKTLYQAALLGLTSYEVGKNSNSEKQIVLASPTNENSTHDVVDSSNSIYILIGVAVLAVTVFLAKELRKCIRCSSDARREIELTNRNQNNNNNIHVEV